MNAARGEKRGSGRGIEQEEEKSWSEKESARAQVRERVSEKERGQRERRGRGVDVDGGRGRGKGRRRGGCDQKRKEGRVRKKSTSEDYGNDIHFFSLSASCFSRALSGFFLSLSLSLSVSLPLLSHPPLVLPRFAGDSSSSFSPSRVKMSGCT